MTLLDETPAATVDEDRAADEARTKSEAAVEAIDRIVDFVFWQLMLADDLKTAASDIDLLVAAIRLRWAQVLHDVTHAELES